MLFFLLSHGEHSPYHCTALIPPSIKTEIQLVVDQHFRVKIKDIIYKQNPSENFPDTKTCQFFPWINKLQWSRLLPS